MNFYSFFYMSKQIFVVFFFLLHHINHENVQKLRQRNSICVSLAICCVENHEKLCVNFLSLLIDRPPSHSQLLKLHTNDFPLVLKTTKFYHYISVIFSHSTTFSLLSDIDKLELGHKRWCLFFFSFTRNSDAIFQQKKINQNKMKRFYLLHTFIVLFASFSWDVYLFTGCRAYNVIARMFSCCFFFLFLVKYTLSSLCFYFCSKL